MRIFDKIEKFKKPQKFYKNIPGSALGAADSFEFLPSPLKRGVLGSAQACHASGVTKGPRPWQISDTPKAGHCLPRKDFLTPATILQIHIRGRHRGVRRCGTGKPGSVLHRGSVNMSRGSPCRCGHGSKRKDPTLGCRRNRVFLRPFQIGNSFGRASPLACGVQSGLHTVTCNATASYLPAESAPVHTNEHA